MTVRWLHSALLSLRAVHSHISIDNADAARRVVLAIKSATNGLGQFPTSGRPGTVKGTRELVVRNLPFVLVYRIVGSDVEIIRVFHTATDWQAGIE